jgi:hypothetical protein
MYRVASFVASLALGWQIALVALVARFLSRQSGCHAGPGRL